LKIDAALPAAEVKQPAWSGWPATNAGSRVTTPDDRVIDSFLIDYVSAFVPNASGEYFNSHVSTGLAPRTYLDKLLAETS
jgi:hypothetical protein